jgi:hypothetical protein
MRFFQHRSGMVDDGIWDGIWNNLLWFFHRPRTQHWRRERRLGFGKSLSENLESTSETDMTAQDGR